MSNTENSSPIVTPVDITPVVGWISQMMQSSDDWVFPDLGNLIPLDEAVVYSYKARRPHTPMGISEVSILSTVVDTDHITQVLHPTSPLGAPVYVMYSAILNGKWSRWEDDPDATYFMPLRTDGRIDDNFPVEKAVTIKKIADIIGASEEQIVKYGGEDAVFNFYDQIIWPAMYSCSLRHERDGVW